jgi:hypothetical protein
MTIEAVLIEWIDAHADANGWCDRDDLDPEPRVITTVGIVLRNVKPQHLTVALSVDEEKVDSVISIPTAVIKRVVRLVDGLSLPLEPAD